MAHKKRGRFDKNGAPAVVTRRPDTTAHGDRRTKRERDRSTQERKAIEREQGE